MEVDLNAITHTDLTEDVSPFSIDVFDCFKEQIERDLNENKATQKISDLHSRGLFAHGPPSIEKNTYISVVRPGELTSIAMWFELRGIATLDTEADKPRFTYNKILNHNLDKSTAKVDEGAHNSAKGQHPPTVGAEEALATLGGDSPCLQSAFTLDEVLPVERGHTLVLDSVYNSGNIWMDVIHHFHSV